MKRFPMLLAVAAVAGAMYVAAAPGSAQHAPPSWKQFTALQKQVASLKKKVNSLQTEADGEGIVILHCILHQVIGVSQKGDPAGTFGYAYASAPGPANSFTTALDAVPTTGATYLIAGFNSDPACMNFVAQAGLRHAAAVFAQQR